MAELTVPTINFSPLGELGKIYKDAQNDRGLKDAFSQGIGSDPQSLAALAQRVAPYNPQLAINLAQLSHSYTRQGTQDARQQGLDTFNQNMERQRLTLAQNADKRAQEAADEGKTAIKEVTNPDGTTSLVRVKLSGEAGPIAGTISANPKKNPFQESLLKQDAERVNDYSEKGKLAEEGTATLDQIDNLRKQAFTAPVIGPLASKVGYPANQALDAATNSLALDVAQKMKGSLSDKDIGFVKSQVPTAATGGAAGDAASSLIRAGFERTKQRAAFYRTWAEANGNINGADAAWNRYVNENPLTVEDRKALGGRRFDPNYNRDFSRYISVSRPVSGTSTATAPRTTGPTGPTTQIGAAPPKVGELQDGYRFRGGDPGDPNSWVLQSGPSFNDRFGAAYAGNR